MDNDVASGGVGGSPACIDSVIDRPAKRMRMEKIPPCAQEKANKPGSGYICDNKMKAVFSTLQRNVDNMVVAHVGMDDLTGMAELNDDISSNDTIADLAAMSGHVLGATATLTPDVFKERANLLVEYFDHDKIKVAEFYRQARLARFIMEADYLVTGTTIKNGSDESSPVDVGKKKGKPSIRPAKSSMAFTTNFGSEQMMFDQAKFIYQHQK